MRCIPLEYLTQLSPHFSLLVKHLDLCLFVLSSVSSHPCHLSATFSRHFVAVGHWRWPPVWSTQSIIWFPCMQSPRQELNSHVRRPATKTDLCAVWHLWPQRTNFAFNKAFKDVTTTFYKVFLCVFLFCARGCWLSLCGWTFCLQRLEQKLRLCYFSDGSALSHLPLERRLIAFTKVQSSHTNTQWKWRFAYEVALCLPFLF